MSMESPEEKDEITALLDITMHSAMDHVHTTCETVEATMMITIYKDANGDFSASSTSKGNIFALIGAAQMWLNEETRIR